MVNGSKGGHVHDFFAGRIFWGARGRSPQLQIPPPIPGTANSTPLTKCISCTPSTQRQANVYTHWRKRHQTAKLQLLRIQVNPRWTPTFMDDEPTWLTLLFSAPLPHLFCSTQLDFHRTTNFQPSVLHAKNVLVSIPLNNHAKRCKYFLFVHLVQKKDKKKKRRHRWGTTQQDDSYSLAALL